MRREKILEVNDLTVSFKTPNGLVRAVRGVSFDLYKGETLAIVGESGSGKSVTTRAIMGILAGNGIIDRGEILYRNQDLTKLSEANFHKIRGNKIGMIFQDPLSSLNPIMKIGKQITEAMLVNGDHLKNLYHDLYHHEYHDYLNQLTLIKLVKENIKHRHNEINLDSDIPKEEKKTKFSEYKIEKHALIKEYKKLVPELKVKYHKKKKVAKVQTKEEKRKIRAEQRVTRTKLLEQLAINEAKHKEVLSSLTVEEKAQMTATFDVKKSDLIANYQDEILKLQEQYVPLNGDLSKHQMKEEKKQFNAAQKVKRKEVKAKLDEDMAVLNKPIFNSTIEKLDNLIETSKEEISQNREAFTRKLKVTKQEAFEKAIEIMIEVGIDQPVKRFTQYPFQFSGGMRQRIVIAIALTANPELLICDEPTTALDVTIQGQILNLIKQIKRERDLSVIFITHDLGVVANMANRVAVMYAGKIVEYGDSTDIFYRPQHPYTWALLSSVPDLDTTDKLLSIPGTPPDMLFPPKGDAFAARNKHALKIDFEEQPPFFKISDTHYAATWLLHSDAPKIEMPHIINERVNRYKEQVKIDALKHSKKAKSKVNAGDQVG